MSHVAFKRALHTAKAFNYISTIELGISAKEPYILAKEPYIPAT